MNPELISIRNMLKSIQGMLDSINLRIKVLESQELEHKII